MEQSNSFVDMKRNETERHIVTYRIYENAAP